MTDFSIRISQLRKQHGYTQRKASELLEINVNTLASYERGIREPNITTIIKFARLYNVTTDYLFGLPSGRTSIIQVPAYPSEITISGKRFVLTEKKESEE